MGKSSTTSAVYFVWKMLYFAGVWGCLVEWSMFTFDQSKISFTIYILTLLYAKLCTYLITGIKFQVVVSPPMRNTGCFLSHTINAMRLLQNQAQIWCKTFSRWIVWPNACLFFRFQSNFPVPWNCNLSMQNIHGRFFLLLHSLCHYTFLLSFTIRTH